MNWNTVQWIIGIALFVVFLVVMMRGCGGMGGCGMSWPMERKRRQGRMPTPGRGEAATGRQSPGPRRAHPTGSKARGRVPRLVLTRTERSKFRATGGGHVGVQSQGHRGNVRLGGWYES